MKLTPLASGSAGNSFLIQGDGAAILCDAGLSGKQMEGRLAAVALIQVLSKGSSCRTTIPIM